MNTTLLHKPGDTVRVNFLTRDSDGVSTAADSTPTGALFVNGASNGNTVTISNVTGGLYTAAFTAPGAAGNLLTLKLSATVGGLTSEDLISVRLIASDVTDAVRLGMTALPNAAAAAAGGLLTFGSGSGQLNPSAGVMPANVAKWAGYDVTYSVQGYPNVNVALWGGDPGALANLDAHVSDCLRTQDAAGIVQGAMTGLGLTEDRATKLDNLNAAVSTRATVADLAGLLQGRGASACTLTFAHNGTPTADADVWVTSDAAGASVVAGTKQTNSQGKVTFLLDAGATYYAWLQKDGINPILGRQFVAAAD